MAYLYSRPERLADGTVHVLGITASILATLGLLFHTARVAGAADIAAVGIYGAAAIFLFSVSALYHMTPWERLRPYFQRIDHAAIFLMIAGTYTPLVVMIGTAFSFVVLGFVWALALLGALGKLTNILTPGWPSTALYLGLGWMAVVLFWPMVLALPRLSVACIVGGGLLYSAGVPFLYIERHRFGIAIWHSFVLAASTLFFLAIALGLIAQSASI